MRNAPTLPLSASQVPLLSSYYLGLITEHLLWYKKYYDFLDAQPKVRPAPQPLPCPQRLDIFLENVTFGYSGQPPIFEGLNLTLPEGQIVAIVGENGAGKSSLVKLLLRFYDPTAGRILIGPDKIDLRQLDIQAWRSQFAAVFQDFSRFEWTISQNIVLAAPRDEQRLAQVLRSSGLEATVNRLPSGLQTRLGQAFGGVDLSGGQWQKLAMARAFYRGARILVLDEPTAALDPRSEAEVFRQFAELAKGRTALMVTHRLGSVVMADRILVLRGGRIAEDGTHEELLALGGEYAELWHLQAQQYGAALPIAT